MNIIELRPQTRGRWKVFETPGVEPIFPDQDGALSYASSRMRSRSGEVRIISSAGTVEEVISFAGGRVSSKAPRGGVITMIQATNLNR